VNGQIDAVSRPFSHHPMPPFVRHLPNGDLVPVDASQVYGDVGEGDRIRRPPRPNAVPGRALPQPPMRVPAAPTRSRSQSRSQPASTSDPLRAAHEALVRADGIELDLGTDNRPLREDPKAINRQRDETIHSAESQRDILPLPRHSSSGQSAEMTSIDRMRARGSQVTSSEPGSSDSVKRPLHGDIPIATGLAAASSDYLLKLGSKVFEKGGREAALPEPSSAKATALAVIIPIILVVLLAVACVWSASSPMASTYLPLRYLHALCTLLLAIFDRLLPDAYTAGYSSLNSSSARARAKARYEWQQQSRQRDRKKSTKGLGVNASSKGTINSHPTESSPHPFDERRRERREQEERQAAAAEAIRRVLVEPSPTPSTPFHASADDLTATNVAAAHDNTANRTSQQPSPASLSPSASSPSSAPALSPYVITSPIHNSASNTSHTYDHAASNHNQPAQPSPTTTNAHADNDNDNDNVSARISASGSPSSPPVLVEISHRAHRAVDEEDADWEVDVGDDDDGL